MSAALDLTDTAARAERDRLAGRTDVIDRVGVLRTLPDDINVSTAEVANFYEVDRETILKVVQRNRDELDDDGFRIISRSEVVDILSVTPDELGMPRTAPSLSLFPRRAVLRIGMLLRDSAVARKIRDYLLGVEQSSPFRIPQTMSEALRLAADEHDRAELAEAEVRELRPKAEVADKLLTADGDLSVKDAAQSLTRAGVKTGQNRLFRTLETRYRWVSRGADGRYRVNQRAIESGHMSVIPQSHYHPRTGVLVLDPPQPRITPKGLQRILADHGGAS